MNQKSNQAGNQAINEAMNQSGTESMNEIRHITKIKSIIEWHQWPQINPIDEANKLIKQTKPFQIISPKAFYSASPFKHHAAPLDRLNSKPFDTIRMFFLGRPSICRLPYEWQPGNSPFGRGWFLAGKLCQIVPEPCFGHACLARVSLEDARGCPRPARRHPHWGVPFGIQARQVGCSSRDEAKAFAFPICCVHHIPPSQENLGEDHLALKLAREVAETGLWGPALVGPLTITVADGVKHQLTKPNQSIHQSINLSTIKQSSNKWSTNVLNNKVWIWSADAVLRRLRPTFFDVEDETSECLKRNANTGRCLWISPARWLYWRTAKRFVECFVTDVVCVMCVCVYALNNM